MRSLQLIQRGFENTIANWPVILLNVAGQMAMMILIVLAVVVAIVPLIVFGAVSIAGFGGDPAEFIEGLFRNNPLIGLYILFVVILVIIPAIMVFAFFEAGKTGIYVDGERAAMASSAIDRSRFHVFAPASWFAHARAHWWKFFLIYNIIWGILAAILLVIFGVVIGLAVLAAGLGSGQPPVGAIVIGCFGGLVALAVMFAGGVAAWVFQQLAMVVAVRDRAGTIDALRGTWRTIRGRTGDVLVLSILLIVILLAIGGVFGSFFFFIGIGSELPGVALLLVPLQVALSLLQSVVSAFTSSLVTACYVAFGIDDQGAAPAHARNVLQ